MRGCAISIPGPKPRSITLPDTTLSGSKMLMTLLRPSPLRPQRSAADAASVAYPRLREASPSRHPTSTLGRTSGKKRGLKGRRSRPSYCSNVRPADGISVDLNLNPPTGPVRFVRRLAKGDDGPRRRTAPPRRSKEQSRRSLSGRFWAPGRRSTQHRGVTKPESTDRGRPVR